VKNLDIF